jgi:hypothetical protein
MLEIDEDILELGGVRHVPNLFSNLVSYGQLEDQGLLTKPLYHSIAAASTF